MIERDMTSSKRRTVSIWLIVLLGCVCLCMSVMMVSCGISIYELRPAPAPDPFPNTDIVFTGEEKLGFVNEDGTGLTTNRFRVPYNDFVSAWGSPMIAGDDETLIITISKYPGIKGKIFVAHSGEIATDCGWYGIARLAADGYHILLETHRGQEKYRLEDCGTDNQPVKVYNEVFGALSPDEQYSAEVRWSEPGVDYKPSIIIHDLKSGEEKVVGEGNFPVWSRDGQWLAYTGVDGLYVIQNSTTTVPMLLVSLERPHPEFGVKVYQEYSPDRYYPPIASWSPDGKWVVFHAYHLKPVDLGEAHEAPIYSVVKVNVSTGETTKLLDGGYSPFWRWPIDKP